jgi:photosystem II stability/assembly factor-like uncharacterized protein
MHLKHIPGSSNYTSYGDDGMIGITKDFGVTFQYDQNLADVINQIPLSSFYDVHYASNDVGYAVGTDKLVAKTTDAGLTWTLVTHLNTVTCGSADDFYLKVFALNADTLLVMKRDGDLVWSGDGGLNFISVNLGTYFYGDIHFPNDSVGYISMANDIWRTADAGVSWTHIYYDPVPINGFGYCQIFFTSDSVGYAARSSSSSNVMRKTVDAGNSWSSIQTIAAWGQGQELEFLNDSVAYYNNGQVWGTRDFGATWSTYMTSDSTFELGDVNAHIEFQSIDSALIVDVDHHVFQTTDSANSWTHVPGHFKPTTGKKIKLINDSLVFAQAFRFTSDNIKYYTAFVRSEDHGHTWSAPMVVDTFLYYTNQIEDFAFANRDTGVFITNNDELYYTFDGGASWTPSNLTTAIDYQYPDLDFKDDVNGVMAGTGNVIARTMDGGENWTEIYNDGLPLNTYPSQIFYLDNKILWLKGAAPFSVELFVSLDEGYTWTQVPLPVSLGNFSYPNLYVINENVWTFANNYGGYDYEVYRTIDGGNNWFLIHNQPGEAIHGPVNFFDEWIGVMHVDVNGSGCGYRKMTLDGGATWTVTDTVVSSFNYYHSDIDKYRLFTSSNPSELIWLDRTGYVKLMSCDGPTPQISVVGNYSICYSDSLTITASGAGNYVWSNGSTAPSINVSQEGEYYVTAVSASYCPVRSNVLTLTVEEPASIALPFNGVLCDGDTTTLVASSLGTHLWSTGQSTNMIEVSNAGIYTLQTTNTCGTTLDSMSVVFVNNPLVTQLNSDTSICYGDTFTATAAGGTIYTWSPATFFENPGQSSTLAHPDSSGFLTIIAEQNGCFAMDSFHVHIWPEINVQLSANLDSLFTNTLGSNYEWFIDGTLVGTTIDPFWIATVNGNYHLILTDVNGCFQLSDTITLLNIGVPDFDDGTISIYPNPSESGIFNIGSTGKSNQYFKMCVTDIIGRTVLCQGIQLGANNIVSVDLSRYPGGQYLVTLSNESEFNTRRIVLVR